MMPQLLAQKNVLERLGGIRKGFDRSADEAFDFGPLLLFLGASAVIVLMLFLLHRIRQRKALHIESRHPTRLFSRAMRSLGVGWVDRCIVRWIAGSNRMSNPTVLLLSRPTYETCTEQWLANVQFGPLREHFRQRLAGVSEKAFGAS